MTASVTEKAGYADYTSIRLGYKNAETKMQNNAKMQSF